MKAEIIAVGTELLLGHIANTNAAYLSRKLAELGIDVFFHATVGDNQERLLTAISAALRRSDLIIMTGGLGPTVDDITAETIARLMDAKLVFNKAVMNDIKEHFRSRHLAVPPGTDRQAHVPEHVRLMRNTVGTAPGLIVERDEKVIIALPGPPRELHPMFERAVIPYLAKKAGSGWTILTRTIKMTGLAESHINKITKDLLSIGPNPTIGIYARLGEVDLKITAKAKDAKTGRRLIGPIEKKIVGRLKEYIYGYDEDTLENAVAKILTKKRLTIATAESCTGGLVSHRLTNVSGSSRYFMHGVIAYSNRAKTDLLFVPKDVIVRFGAVSGSVALAMANGIKRLSDTDIGVSLTGIAGPAGGTKKKPVGLVFIALATHKKRFVKECHFKGTRQEIKLQASQAALDLIRKHA